MIITEPFPAMYHFIKSRLHLDMSADLRLIGQVKKNEIVAVVGYNNFMGNTCMIHCAGDGRTWMNKEIIWASMDFPFNQCEMAAVICVVRQSNKQSWTLLEKLGYQKKYTIKDGFMEGDDLAFYEIRREQAERWLAFGERYGQELTQSAARA